MVKVISAQALDSVKNMNSRINRFVGVKMMDILKNIVMTETSTGCA